MPLPHYLRELNPEQQSAALATEGPVLILAGAGSGKTRTLIFRIVHLLAQGVSARRILAVTFTNKAASEMRERVQKQIGRGARGLTVSTFHSLGARILREHGAALGLPQQFSIYSTGDQVALIKRLISEEVHVAPTAGEETWDAKRVLYQVSSWKNRMVRPDEARREVVEGRMRENRTDDYAVLACDVYPRYEEALRAAGACDFDDLLLLPVELLQKHVEIREALWKRWQYLMVDEYQDTNGAQFELARLMAGPHKNLCVVGDDDQCLLPGTPVATPGGPVPVERIARGATVVAASGGGASAPGEVDARMERHYSGPALRLETASGREVRLTPNHLVFARTRVDPEVHCVYLMHRRGLGYRIGITRGVRARRGGDRVSGLAVRVNQERADRAWILATCESESEARFLEALWASRYGIPTVVFHPRGRRIALTQEQIDRLYAELDTEAGAERLLADRLMSPEYPHHVPPAVVRGESERRLVDVTLFGDPRDYQGRPWRDHRIQLVTSGEPVRERVSARFPTRAGKQGTWRVETARKHHDDAWSYARRLAAEVEGEVRIHGRLCAPSGEGTARSGTFSLMPAGHVHPGMEMAVLGPDGEVTPERVLRREAFLYEGMVYDLSVPDLRNYFAGGICVHNSIYAWRGADVRNILDFERHFPGARVIFLEENYRSTQRILDAANAVIAHNAQRKAKRMRTGNGLGPKLDYYEMEEANGRGAEEVEAEMVAREIGVRRFREQLQWGDFAVLYRANHQSRTLEEALRTANIPYRVVGGTSYFDRKEVADAAAYLRLVLNPNDEVSLRRIVNYPTRGIGRTTQLRLAERASAEGVSLWEMLSRVGEVEGTNRAQAEAVLAFVRLIERAREELRGVEAALQGGVPGDASLQRWAEAFFRELRLEEALRQENKSDKVAEIRVDNLRDFAASMGTYEQRTWAETPLPDEEADWNPPSLAGFLERISLVNEEEPSQDQKETGEERHQVTLMTLHSAKGLEWAHVFLVGLEEEILPHARSVSEAADGTGADPIAEERRLFYVGITRARHRLTLSGCRTRRRGGEAMPRQPSRFLKEIPTELLDMRSPSAESSLSTEDRQELRENFFSKMREMLGS
jgi:DNA helicase-2/ATP-dependent DNA helicase PcrA